MRKLTIAIQLGLGFGVMVMLVLVSSLMVWMETVQSEQRAGSARHATAGAVALADAQSALWQLRYGFPQFMVSDEAARRKIVEDEPRYYATIEKALKAYAETDPSEEELKSLKALQEIYGKYIAARPKWFELYGAGKLEEAKEWRAATTTPFGAGTVKAFTDLIELQQKASAENHLAGLQELKTTRMQMAGVAALAAVIGLILATVIIRGLRNQLGGEPAYAKQVAARIAEGDLASDVQVRAGDRDSLLFAMKKMRDNLRAVVGDVVSGARSVSDASGQLAQGNQELSQRTEMQASTLEETASSMEEFASTVTQNAENAKQASQLAVGASDVARKGGEVVGHVVNTMTGISESSRKIADIIGVIDGIAFQTNILALNAAVEAARAGEQGRGFAVVATEVRNLAQRSAAAAKEIKSLIGDSVNKVEAGTKLVDDAGRTMGEIVRSVKQVSDLISEIAAASQEQSSGIAQVNAAITQMDGVVQQNASLVEEAAAATESMKAQAAALTAMVSRFQLAGRAGTPDTAHSILAAAPASGRAPEAARTQAIPAPISYKPMPQRSAAAIPSTLNGREDGPKGEWRQF